MIGKNKLKLGCAAVTAAVAPFLITQAAKNPPDVNKIMAAAVDFTAAGGFSTEGLDFGNGELILYKPSKPPEASQSYTLPKETTVKEETEILTEETESQAETEASPKTELTTEAELPEETNAPAENTSEEAKEPQTQPAEENPFIIVQNINHDTEDLTVFGNNDLKVYRNTFKPSGGSNFIDLDRGGQVRNCTELDNDFVRSETKISTDIKLDAFSEEPQVLIMHAHACESYLVGDGSYQDKEYTCRTTDSTQSVVAVGQKISEALASKGICVIHDGTMHDYPAYNGCYDRAEETVSAILKQYPSIKVVLDIHRDGIVESDGNPIAAVTEINGKPAAQVMIISAATDGYYYVPEYLQNFHFACLLQQYMESENPTLTRPVLFEYCQYNQHLTTGSLLLEIGSQGNTLGEALYTGELIGESIGNALLTLCD